VSKALWLLLAFQFRGWLRYAWRGLHTIKGAFLALVGVMFFAAIILPAVFVQGQSLAAPEQIRTYGPTALVLYCLYNVLISSGDRAIYFPPAEVDYLFPAPLGRREVLLYKILTSFLITLPIALVPAIFLNAYTHWAFAGYVGLVLGIMFMQLFSMAVTLIGMTIGAAFYSRARILVGLLGALLVVDALMETAAAAGVQNLPDVMALLRANPIWQAVTWPLRSFFDAFLAQSWAELVPGADTQVTDIPPSPIPGLAEAAGIALMVDLLLAGIVLLLDVQYLETAADVSARIYTRQQRIRRSGVLTASSSSGNARLSLPVLPWWGGMGPILWRQLLTAQRGLVKLLIVFTILSLVMVMPMLVRLRAEGDKVPPVPQIATMLLLLTIFLTTLVPFDFRGDIDRIALLKTLPVRPWRLAVGQLLAPVLVISTVQWVILAVSSMFTSDHSLLLIVGLYMLPVNFFLFALENLLFLMFPTRVIVAAAGDFQGLGRNFLLMIAKLIGLLLVFVLAAIPGALVWALTGYRTAALAAGWPMVVLCGAALVPLIVLAFRRFDVTSDTPP
jgi:hypothetical protein